MTQYFSRIIGWGAHVPERVLTNRDLEKILDTSDEWIVTHTGIRERRIAAEDETTVDLAVRAAQAAIERAGITAADLDLIILSTSTPDYLCPPASSLLQDRLGAHKCGAMTMITGCTGFLYSLVTAAQFVQTGAYQYVLVVGAEKLSYAIDYTDRNTSILFGDGAGAVVVSRSTQPGGLQSHLLRSEGTGWDALIVPGIGSASELTPDALERKQHKLKMDGQRVFKFAARVMTNAVTQVVGAAGLTMSDIDLLIPHQSNERLIDLSLRRLDFPREKTMVNLDRYGNTSAAALPLALCEALDENRLQPGDQMALVAFGAGLTYAACVWQWQGAEVEEEPILVTDWPVSETFRERLQDVRVAAWRAQVQARTKVSDAAMAVMVPLYTFRKGVKKRLGR